VIKLENMSHFAVGLWKRSPITGFAALCTALVVAVTVLNVLVIGAPMILDDLDELEHVRSFNSVLDAVLRPDCYGLFRPVKNVLFFAVANSGRFATVLRHVIPWGAYLLACMLFIQYANRLLKNRTWAVLCALVWTLSPTQVSSVAWFSCANILVMALFFLAGMLLYDTGIRRGGFPRAPARVPMVFSGLCFFLAVLSYEAAVAFPALLVMHDAVTGRRPGRKDLARVGCFGLVALAAVAIRLAGAGRMSMGSEGFSPMTDSQIVFASGHFFLDHLAWWFFPVGRQEILGTFVWGASLPAWVLGIEWGLLICLGAVLLLLWKKAPLISFGMLWYFVAFSPVSNLIPLKNGPFADYYLVLPGMGLALALVATARRILEVMRGAGPRSALRRVAVSALVFLILWRGGMAAASFAWATTWRSPAELFRRSVESGPVAFRARANLARIYKMAGASGAARTLARQSIEEAPWYALSYNVLGDVETLRGDYRSACTNYSQAIEADPRNSYPYFAMAYVCETHLNETEKAVSYYEQVLMFPWNRYSETASLNLSRLYAVGGRVDEAIRIMEEALKYVPSSSALRHNLDVAYRQKEEE